MTKYFFIYNAPTGRCLSKKPYSDTVIQTMKLQKDLEVAKNFLNMDACVGHFVVDKLKNISSCTPSSRNIPNIKDLILPKGVKWCTK